MYRSINNNSVTKSGDVTDKARTMKKKKHKSETAKVSACACSALVAVLQSHDQHTLTP